MKKIKNIFLPAFMSVAFIFGFSSAPYVSANNISAYPWENYGQNYLQNWTSYPYQNYQNYPAPVSTTSPTAYQSWTADPSSTPAVSLSNASIIANYLRRNTACPDQHYRSQRNGSCQPVPAYATANSAKNGWFCNWGYKLNTSTYACNPFVIPENSTLNYWGTSWTCNSGYTHNWRMNTCDPIRNYRYHI